MVSHKNMDPDLHRAISMRPSPFHTNPERVPESPSPTFLPLGHLSHLHSSAERSKSPAQSTAVEAADDGEPAASQRPTYTRNSSDGQRDDIEAQSLPTYTDLDDPYKLRSGLKTAEDIEGIQANMSKKRVAACVHVPGSQPQARKLRGFYEEQNENIERLLKPVDQHLLDAREEAGADALKFKIAVRGSFAANILLAVLQIYGATSSGSISLYTTMADAIFDPLSNTTLILCHRAVNRVNPLRFPSGKSRIETAGNIAFCFLMTSVSFILIVLSARELDEGSSSETQAFHLPSVLAVAIALVTKFCLFLYCYSLRNRYSMIRILYEDHRNDIMINSLGLTTSVLGSKLRWWLDPAGAICISVLIATLWLRTAWAEFSLLIGVTASPAFLQHITYISMTHSPLIRQLDTVRAWHSGPRIIVEVDIVMDRHRTLEETHDTAEALQMKLESLPDVERAYVHVDYETDHAPEHFVKKEL